MIPQIPFDEMGIVLATMTTGVTALYFALVAVLNLLGLYIQDMQIDKEKAKKVAATATTMMTTGAGTVITGDKPYELEWLELAPYAVVSAIFTMAIFEIYQVQFWAAMVMAILMGMTFRAVLPKIVTLFAEKAEALITAIFGSLK
jgi:hypothetical protein